MLHHIAGKGHGEVVAEAFLTQLRCQTACGSVRQGTGIDAAQEIAGVEYLEEQLVALLTVFAPYKPYTSRMVLKI